MNMMRGDAAEACQAHTLEVAGSNPAPATKIFRGPRMPGVMTPAACSCRGSGRAESDHTAMIPALSTSGGRGGFIHISTPFARVTLRSLRLRRVKPAAEDVNPLYFFPPKTPAGTHFPTGANVTKSARRVSGAVYVSAPAAALAAGEK